MTTRILHVHPGNMLGGTERVLANIARRTQPGVENHFALLTSVLGDQISGLAPVNNIPDVRLRNPLSVVRAQRALKRILRENEFSLVLTHAAWTQALFGRVLARSTVPSVFWLRGRVTGKGWIERLARRGRPDFALCNSEFTCGTIDLLYPGIERTVIYNPLPEVPPRRSRAEVRAELQADEDDVVVVMVSRMEKGKGHRHLIDSIAAFTDRRIVCWIVGGPQRASEEILFDELKSRANRQNLNHRVKFLGMRKDVADLYGAADVFCQPNVLPEGFGNTFIEALYAGLPVVTTAMGGALEIVTDKCGLLVEPGSTPQLSHALQQLAQDWQMRKKLGRNGPDRARELCEPEQQFAKLYRELQNFLDSR